MGPAVRIRKIPSLGRPCEGEHGPGARRTAIAFPPEQPKKNPL